MNAVCPSSIQLFVNLRAAAAAAAAKLRLTISAALNG
jgi:hypothetical protein